MRDPRTHVVIGAALDIHRTLGPGMLESAYRRVLAYELRRAGLAVSEEHPFDLVWGDLVVPNAFRVDLMIERSVIVEVKAVASLHPIVERQVLTYLQWSGVEVGLILNFGAPRMKDGIVRLIRDNDRAGLAR